MRGCYRILLGLLLVCASLTLSAVAARADGVITLKQAINRALEFAPSLGLATAQSDLSAARVNEAQSYLYPDLLAAGEYNQSPGYSPTIANEGLTLGQLVLNYTVWDGGLRAAKVRAARYAAEAASMGVRAVQSQITFDTTVAYFDLLMAHQTETEQKANLKRLTRYVAIIKALRRTGRAIANDVLQIEAARDSAELALAQARQAREEASLTLGSLIGELDQSDLVVASVSTPPQMPTGKLVESPAYEAAQRQVEAAQLQVTAAKAERAPTIKLQLTAGWVGINPPHTFNHNLGASYDAALSLPLFQGGLVRSHIDEARATEDAAKAQERQIKLQLERALSEASVRYRNALGQLGILASSQSTMDDSFALDWTRFLGGGNVTLLEVMDAYQKAESLRLARFQQEFAARQAAAQAALVLGLVQ